MNVPKAPQTPEQLHSAADSMRLRQQAIQLASLQEKLEQYEQLVHDCTQQMQAKDEQLAHLEAQQEKQATLLADAQHMLQVKEQLLEDKGKPKASESPASEQSEWVESDFVSKADHSAGSSLCKGRGNPIRDAEEFQCKSHSTT